MHFIEYRAQSIIILSLGTPCADRYYSLGRQAHCIPCPPGYSCVDQTIEPVVCERGFYNDGSLTECMACDAGYACPEGSKAARPADGLCPLGYYCVDGKDTTPCPAGWCTILLCHT